MIEKSGCEYIFEWSTPVVCPDEENVLGCSVIDEQLHYAFNLSSLAGKLYKVIVLLWLARGSVDAVLT